MPASRLTRTLTATLARRMSGALGRALHPLPVAGDGAEEAPAVDERAPSIHDDGPPPADSSVTRELLLATAADEPPAQRATRQARLYLERRRRQLNEQLRGGR